MLKSHDAKCMSIERALCAVRGMDNFSGFTVDLQPSKNGECSITGGNVPIGQSQLLRISLAASA